MHCKRNRYAKQIHIKCKEKKSKHKCKSAENVTHNIQNY